MLKDIIKTLKINHYIKNIIVILPLFFSMNYANINLCLECLIVFVSFCFISSSVYILNDIIDIEKDKMHPIKCNRPIASGRLSKPFAVVILIMLFCVSILAAKLVNFLCVLMVIFYFILNVFYSLCFKNIVIVDVACIAFGFILRIIAGCFAINVIPSAFVILMTFFASMFFTFTKRKMELKLVGKNECRASIKGFDISAIDQFILVNAILSIAFYFTYTMDEVTIHRAGTEFLYITTIPFTLLVFRFLYLINFTDGEDDPIIFMKDAALKIFAVFYIIVFVAAYML